MSGGHTKGPWRVVKWSEKEYEIRAGQGHNEKHICGFCLFDDASLIAAAPELLRELIGLRERFHAACLAVGRDHEFVSLSTLGADAAIAKATNGSAPL